MNSVRIATKTRRPGRSRKKSKGAEQGASELKQLEPTTLSPRLIEALERLTSKAKISRRELHEALQEVSDLSCYEHNQHLEEAEAQHQRMLDECRIKARREAHQQMLGRTTMVLPADERITPRQCAAARALLDWTQQELADSAGVSLSCVSDFETERRNPRADQMSFIRQAIECAGTEFTRADVAWTLVRQGAHACGGGVRWRLIDESDE